MNRFVAFSDELASSGEEIDRTDKSSKLIRPLIASFFALAMVTSVTDTTLDTIAEAVKAELARRVKPNNPLFTFLGQANPQYIQRKPIEHYEVGDSRGTEDEVLCAADGEVEDFVVVETVVADLRTDSTFTVKSAIAECLSSTAENLGISSVLAL